MLGLTQEVCMKNLMLVVILLALVILQPSVAVAGELRNDGAMVYRFADEPFDFWQCYKTSSYFPGPAATFGEDVCVHYLAMNSETVRIKGSDVEWSLIQHGTATIYAQDDNTVLYQGPFQVEEKGRDYNGDARCLWVDGRHAWLGICDYAGFFANLDFAEYHWKIAGNSIYYFQVTISAPGVWCYSSKQGGSWGPGCR